MNDWPRVLFIVAADRPDLLHYAERGFLPVKDRVTVIVDRRTGERRTGADGTRVDRRRSERRCISVDMELRTFGWAVTPAIAALPEAV